MQGGPAQVVDVVDLDPGTQQGADDVGMSPVRRANQPGTVVAVLRVDVGAVPEGEREQVGYPSLVAMR